MVALIALNTTRSCGMIEVIGIPEWEDWALTSGRTFEEAVEMGKDLYETLVEACQAGEIPPPKLPVA